MVPGKPLPPAAAVSRTALAETPVSFCSPVCFFRTVKGWAQWLCAEQKARHGFFVRAMFSYFVVRLFFLSWKCWLQVSILAFSEVKALSHGFLFFLSRGRCACWELFLAVVFKWGDDTFLVCVQQQYNSVFFCRCARGKGRVVSIHVELLLWYSCVHV